jgi:hypothetical protein
VGDKKTIPALVNIFNPPLVETGDEVETSDLIRLLCPAVVDVVKPTTLAERYKRISSVATEPFILPALPILIEKVVSPLVNAKVAFVAGNPLGTIALCGFVAEMMALMLYEMACDEGRGAGLTNDKFERCGQEKRVEILRERAIIDQDTSEDFDMIRKVRRKYLHFISQEHALISEDAVQVYAKSIRLMVKLVGQEFVKGAWIPEPSFARYLSKHGLW